MHVFRHQLQRFVTTSEFDCFSTQVDYSGSYMCGFETSFCSPRVALFHFLSGCIGKPADVLFVLDNSGSISNVNYGKMMTFVEDLALSFDVGPAKTRLGTITFANDAVTRFHLNTFNDSLDIVGELMAMRRQSGGTNTADALRLAREDGLLEANGARVDYLKVLIVITDGKSRDTPATLEQAQLLRNEGVLVFSVGVGRNLDIPELKGIAGEEFPDRFFESETFDALVDLNVRIIQATCDG